MRDGSHVPLPLAAGFGLFVAALAYLVATSLARRDAPVFVPTPASHVRAPGWTRAGDTLTLDATDEARWLAVSLADGRALAGADSGAGELAVRRYRIAVAGALADLGAVRFEDARADGASFDAPRVIDHWYRYNFVTHLLEPGGHVYALRTARGALWKLQVVGYYCPRLVAGCLTVRYAPLEPSATRAE
jgi:hypothetical protein